MPRDAVQPWRAGIVIPIRSFTDAKARLAGLIDHDARIDAARRMAAQVVDAAAPLPVVVVTRAPEVLEWAAERGVDVVTDPGGLDAAAAAGRAFLAERGLTRVVIAHADLPLARELQPLARDGTQPVVALVPCHRDDGTNVLSVPTDAPFEFAYGPGSFRRHAAEARRLGLGVRVVRSPELAVDVDGADDLHYLDALYVAT
jgi:2-phospho-L-lactate/phosphoenolpyruvate guanylyltransferase